MPARPRARRSARSTCRDNWRRSQRSVVLPARSSKAARLGWRNAFVIAAFAASAVLAVLFVLRERRAPQPMLPLSLFSHRMFALTSLVGLFVNVAFYGLIFVFSLYFQRVNGLSPFATGLAFLPMLGAGAAGQPRRRAGGRAHRRARDHRARRRPVGNRMPGAARHRTRHRLLGNRDAARRSSAAASGYWCRR